MNDMDAGLEPLLREELQHLAALPQPEAVGMLRRVSRRRRRNGISGAAGALGVLAIVMGTGAGLAAAVALRARDQQGPPIRFQLLNQPALDDRQETWSARNFTDTPWADRDTVTAAWRHYLGSTPASPYAAPARADDLSGLPPAYIATAEFDPSRDEAITYALRLLQAGVSVELHQWAGTFHGSFAILSAEVSQRQIAELSATLRRALTE
ncbi:alpha/beta hydrolase fold domain-containing protein [Micromonospora sp. NPDC050200]|uniref:alpha/beta hydrolase fold domain-containing protein n=1 Tax=Micromonospora sp. NPDC050200 TaxID=3155664 RepID=UPI0033CDD5EF